MKAKRMMRIYGKLNWVAITNVLRSTSLSHLLSQRKMKREKERKKYVGLTIPPSLYNSLPLPSPTIAAPIHFIIFLSAEIFFFAPKASIGYNIHVSEYRIPALCYITMRFLCWFTNARQPFACVCECVRLLRLACIKYVQHGAHTHTQVPNQSSNINLRNNNRIHWECFTECIWRERESGKNASTDKFHFKFGFFGLGFVRSTREQEEKMEIFVVGSLMSLPLELCRLCVCNCGWGEGEGRWELRR